jgi:hypothetical protein
MASSRMLSRVALVRIGVSEERIASIIRATTIDELRTMLAVTIDRRASKLADYFNPDNGCYKFLRNVGSYKSHTT